MDQRDVADLLGVFAEQTSENALLLIDLDRRIQWCNPRTERLFGYEAHELCGTSIFRLFIPEDRQKHVPEYEFDVASRSEDMNNDRWMQRADGSRFWATGNTVGLRDRTGKVTGFAKIMRDSTDLREQLETFRNQLKVVTESDQHKTLFLAKLSHELRNPLGAISNALELMRHPAGGTTPAEATGIFERQLNQLYRLAEDLLDVTRISTGKVGVKPQLLDVREPVTAAVETVQPLFEKKRHRLIQHILPTPMRVSGDPMRLEQVFVNLLTNAARYTDESGEIEVRASSDENEVFVHVIDHGIGIAPDLLPHVFDLFTRGERAAAHAEDGLGIGLALVKELVDAHGGSVQVRSDGLGKGSEFTVRLPLAESAQSMSAA
jgi:two-component system CheB/CheR fusion protein